MTKSCENNDTMGISRNIRKIYDTYKQEGKVKNQAGFHKLVYPTIVMDDAQRKNHASAWCNNKEITLDVLFAISKATNIPLREIVDDREVNMSAQEESRTLQDWCKILFVDMPKAFSVSWDDARIINNDDLPAPCAYLDIHISLNTTPYIDYNTGYPSGRWGYSYPSNHMLECSKKIKSIMSCYGLSDEQKEQACNNAINDIMPF